jgi:hypothetical protein
LTYCLTNCNVDAVGKEKERFRVYLVVLCHPDDEDEDDSGIGGQWCDRGRHGESGG